MKKFTLYIPLIGGIISIVLAIFVVAYTYTMMDPSAMTLCKMIIIWTGLILLSVYLILQFTSGIKTIGYNEGHDRGYEDAKKDIPF